MADKYIENQRKMIREETRKFLPAYSVAIVLFLFIICVICCLIPPHPDTWKTDEIVFVDAQYRNKMRTIARYASSGYELTDQNGNLYWAGKELTWQELGCPYTIKYYTHVGYRRLVSVYQGDTLIISEAGKAETWKQTAGEIYLLLLILTGILIRILWLLYKAFQNPVILECRRRIRAYEAKMNRRAIEKRHK